MNPQRQAFLDSIRETPDDPAIRGIFADWLDEFTDETEYANFLRSWTPEKGKEAKEWLEFFAGQCGRHCTNYHEVWDNYRRGGENIQDAQDNEDWINLTYDIVVEAGLTSMKDPDEWFTQMGSEGARNMMSSKETRRLFWEYWQTVTGIMVQPQTKEHTVFSCSC